MLKAIGNREKSKQNLHKIQLKSRLRSQTALDCHTAKTFSNVRKAGRANDLICTTPRLCQNNMTPVALRGRGTTSAYNCFPATGLYFKSKVLASVGRGSTETTRLQHGSSMFGDTHAKGGGGGGGILRQSWLHGFPHPCEMRMAS